MPVNNIVEQDHRAIKRIVRPILGFKSFGCARKLIAGIELMHIDQEGAAALPGGPGIFRRRLLLQSRRPLIGQLPASTRLNRLIATEPQRGRRSPAHED